MDITSQAAAIAVPIAAAVGLVGLVTIPALAIRSTKDAICPQRARREAEAREAARAAQRGGAGVIGSQRQGEPVSTG